MVSLEIAETGLFALTLAVGQLTPGPDMLVILKNTLHHGLRTGLWTISGICLGLVVHVTLAFLGLGIIFQQYPKYYLGFRWLGAAYLLWIAWQLLRSLGQRAGEPGSSSNSVEKTLGPFWAFRQGLLTNLLNAKAFLFFSGILAPFTFGHENRRLLYSAIILLEAMVIWPAFAWFMTREQIRVAFFRHTNWFNAGFAALLIAVAIRLAWS